MVLTNDNEDSRRMVESCYKRHKTVLNPIIEWTDDDVWEFIKAENVPYCGLYDDGWKRLGCIGCPMASKHWREKQFLRWPKYKQAYLRTFTEMLTNRRKRKEQDPSRYIWKSGGMELKMPTAMDVFNWWMEYDVLPGQMDLFEMEEED